ncbi:MAG: SDR family NAD(P)-dependent oxidoreductase, partial [Candidatus Eisenbacteria bacterium]|nr:SDR family NAD(P)-dependent oxidoreductase [Candidatus Eisenbacteria bacterium]
MARRDGRDRVLEEDLENLGICADDRPGARRQKDAGEQDDEAPRHEIHPIPLPHDSPRGTTLGNRRSAGRRPVRKLPGPDRMHPEGPAHQSYLIPAQRPPTIAGAASGWRWRPAGLAPAGSASRTGRGATPRAGLSRAPDRQPGPVGRGLRTRAEGIMKIDLTGQSALVTGGSRGIGRAIALRLASAGANVAINYLRQGTRANETAAEIARAGVRSLAIKANVAQIDEIESMFEKLRETFGRLD